MSTHSEYQTSNIAQPAISQNINLSAPKADRTKKKRRRRTVLKRIVDAPLQDTGGRLFDSENAALHEQRDSLLLKHYGELRDSAFDAYPQLSFDDAENILSRLGKRLHQFRTVPLEDDSFLQLATAYVSIQARRQKAFDSIIGEPVNLASARKGIWSILQSCADLGLDSGIAEELEMHVMGWVWANLTKLHPNHRTAKVGTILYRIGWNAARTWKTVRLREKKTYASVETVDQIAESYQPGKLGEGRQIIFPESELCCP